VHSLHSSTHSCIHCIQARTRAFIAFKHALVHSSLSAFTRVYARKRAQQHRMASAQTIERALRERFGSEETILTLAEILAFLKTHQNSHYAAGNPKEKQPQHAAH